MHVFGQSEGIVFQADGGDYFYSYPELSQRIDALILGGIYPFSIEEERLDDFAIPDEREELEESRRNSESGSITGDMKGQESFYYQEQPETWEEVAVGQEQPEVEQENTGRQEAAVGDRQAKEEEPAEGGEQTQEEEPEGRVQILEEAPDRQLSLFDMAS